MRTCDYIDVLNGALALEGSATAALSTTSFNQHRGWANKHFQRAAEEYFWPDLMRLEQRWFRANYDPAVTYTNDGTIIYFPQTKIYYEALKSTLNNPPADSAGNLDTTRWAVAATNWTADNYSATAQYAVGDIRFYPTTQLYYAMHTVGAPGTVPTTAANWGVLTPFDRYIAFAQTGMTAIGEPLEVWDSHPRINPDTAEEFAFEVSENGVQVVDDVPFVWLRYRVRLTNLWGATWSATSIYLAPVQVYFNSDPTVSSVGTPGNFWTAAATTAAGESPLTTPAKWTIVQIPYIFQRYLTQALYAEWLLNEGQMEKYEAAMGRAEKLLSEQIYLLAGQEQQRQRTVVMTR